MVSLRCAGRARVRQTREEQTNLDLPLVGDGKANPMPIEFQITAADAVHKEIPIEMN